MSKGSQVGRFLIIGAGGAYQRPQTGAKSSDKNKSYIQIDVSNDFEKGQLVEINIPFILIVLKRSRINYLD